KKSLYFRLLIDKDKEEGLKDIVDGVCLGKTSDKTFLVEPDQFALLKAKPHAYWVSSSTIRTLGGQVPIEGNAAAIRVGLQTSNDWRFLRLAWEVPNRRICTAHDSVANDRDEFVLDIRSRFKNTDSQWAFFSKTDTASPWFSP